MKKFAAKIGLFSLACGMSMSISAGDATTVLMERLDRGDCVPSSLTDTVWTITTGPVGTHDELNWGDELVFEQVGHPVGFNRHTAFNIWKNGIEWTSAEGWSGSCVRSANLGVYVLTGKVRLDGCLHDLAFGRLDHDDRLGNRIEVIFEHADDHDACDRGHHGDATRHPGHAHGDND